MALVLLVVLTAIAGTYLHRILKMLDELPPGQRARLLETKVRRQIRAVKPKK
jgi:hypothetical protein